MRYFTIAAVLSSIAASTAAMAFPSSQYHGLTARDGSDYAPNPCALADSPALNASMQLVNWVQCATNSFIPYPGNPTWPQGAANAFSKDVRYTFNDTHYDYDTIFKLYASFNATIGAAFSPFKHGITSALAVPNSNGDRGGMAYLIGWEGGFLLPAKQNVWFSNAAFVLVKEENGARKIAEFRESSNIPNSAPLPAQVPWKCPS